MNNLGQITNIFVASFSIFGLLAFLYGPYRHYRIDRLRYEIFDIRGELFLLAMRENLPFEDRAYGMFRQILNGFIRFGDKLNVTSVLMLAISQQEDSRREAARHFAVEWTNAIRELNPKVRAEFRRLEMRMHKAVMVHLALCVPVLLVLLIPLAVPVLAAWATSACLRALEPLFMRVDFTGWKVGENKTRGGSSTSSPALSA